MHGEVQKRKNNRTHSTKAQLGDRRKGKMPILPKNIPKHGKYESAYKKRKMPKHKRRITGRNMGKYNSTKREDRGEQRKNKKRG